MTTAIRIAIVNARVRTGNPRRPWADAVLVRDDVVELVGSSAEVRKLADATVRTIDARGMLVMATEPGAVLEPGTLANLEITDADTNRASPEETGDARVVFRMLAGRVVLDRAGLLQPLTSRGR